MKRRSYSNRKGQPSKKPRSCSTQSGGDVFDQLDDYLLTRIMAFIATSSIKNNRFWSTEDIESIAHMMAVNQRFYTIGSSRELWRGVGHSTLMNATFGTTFAGSYHGKVAGKYCSVSQILRERLIGFVNLGIVSNIRGSPDVCYRVRQRSTGTVLTLKIPRELFRSPSSQKHSQISNRHRASSSASISRAHYKLGQPSSVLQELSLLQQQWQTSEARLNLPCAMDLVDGHLLRLYDDVGFCTLTDFIYREGSVASCSLSVVQAITYQLLVQLKKLHSKGFVHGNLRPDNLLVKQEGEELSMKVKIAGLSCITSNEFSCGMELAKMKSVFYCSPEMLSREHSNSIQFLQSRDLWAVGCIIAEMLIQRPLFRGKTEVDQLCQILKLVGSTSENEELRRHCKSENSLKSLLERNMTCADFAALDLVTSLLQCNVGKRMTINSALQHHFFFKCGGLPLQEICKSSTKSIFLESNAPAKVGDLERIVIDEEAWRRMIDWAFDVTEVFDQSPRLPFLAMDIFQRFCASSQSFHANQKIQYSLLAATCLHMASKIESSSHIGLKDIVFCSDNTFQPAEVATMEENILDALRWVLSCPPLLSDYINLYIDSIELLRRSPVLQWLTKYYAELCLQSLSFHSYSPSQIAACVVTIVLFCVDECPATWPEDLQTLSGYDWEEIRKCTISLYTDIDTMNNSNARKNSSIVNRYGKRERLSVSNIKFPPLRQFEHIVRQA